MPGERVTPTAAYLSRLNCRLTAASADRLGRGPHMWTHTDGFRPGFAASSNWAASGLCHCAHLLSGAAYPGP